MQFILKHKLLLLGVVLGSLAGYAYHYYVGCKTGTCAITSSPFNSTVYGAVMGALLLSSFQKEDSNNTQSENEKR